MEIKIPKEINTSLCPKCIGEVQTFDTKEWFCPECKCIWKDGNSRKTKLNLAEFLAKQLRRK